MNISANRFFLKTTSSLIDVKSASSTGHEFIVLRTRSLPGVILWSFALFAFTIPIEAADLGIMSGSLSLAKISGAFFILLYLCYRNPLFGKEGLPSVPNALWWFLGYVGIYALNGFFISEELVGSFLSRLLTLIQLMVLFWISSSVLEEEGIARRILLAYSLGSVFLAIGFIFGLPGFAAIDIGKGRLTALEEDPNNLAVLMAIASVILIGLCLKRTSNRFIEKFLLPSMILPLLILMVHTGSRSGLFSFVIGCAVYLGLIWRSKQKLTVVVLATIAIAAISYMTFSEDSLVERWQQTYFEHNVAGRDDIALAAIEMFFERPVFGWKPVELWYELGFRVGVRNTKDTHNLLLHLLLEVGLVGTIPFLIGLALCCRAAYRARTGNLGVLPLALLSTTLTANLALTYLERKPFWIVLAFCIAAASADSKRQRKLSTMRFAAHALGKRI